MINAKFPISKVETPAFTVSKSLALVISFIVGAIFSNSKPPTYALPGLTCNANKLELAVLPSSVVPPAVKAPTKFSFLTDVVTDSFGEN